MFACTADKAHASDPAFRRFRRQLFHSSLSKILWSLRPVMEKPEVIECCDGHHRHAIWGVGPYIGDYPEQVLLTCIVQGWCPRSAITFFTTCKFKLIKLDRCQAFHENLDDKDFYERRRTQALTEALINTYDVPILWKEHGIISDVVVRLLQRDLFPSISLRFSPSPMTFHEPIYTN
jgi:hypothetical protein